MWHIQIPKIIDNYYSILPDLNLNVDTSLAKDTYNQTLMISAVNKWIHSLNMTQIKMVQDIPSCKQWMNTFGYKFINIDGRSDGIDINQFERKGLLNIEEMIDTINPFPMKQYLVYSEDVTVDHQDQLQIDRNEDEILIDKDSIVRGRYDQQYMIWQMYLVLFCCILVLYKMRKTICKFLVQNFSN